jgi:hypothetical protein
MGPASFREHHRFHLELDGVRLEERVRVQMRRNNPSDLKLRRHAGRLLLRFPSHESHLVTPQMVLTLSDGPSGGTIVHAVIGPSFGLWKFAKAGLLMSAFCGALGMALAFLQWDSGGMAWGFYLMMIGLAGWLFLYFIMEEGRRRNRDRAELLKNFIDSALGMDCFSREPSPRARAASAPLMRTH